MTLNGETAADGRYRLT